MPATTLTLPICYTWHSHTTYSSTTRASYLCSMLPVCTGR